MNSLNIDCSILGKSYICLSLSSSSDGCNCDFCSCCAITIIYHNQHTMPYHTTPCHTIPYHTIPLPYHIIPYYTIPSSYLCPLSPACFIVLDPAHKVTNGGKGGGYEEMVGALSGHEQCLRETLRNGK